MKMCTILICFFGLNCFGVTHSDCINGSFKACQEVFEGYGRTTKRDGAVELFYKACSSEQLRVYCQIVSSETKEIRKKCWS